MENKQDRLNQELLKSLLRYDPETGGFVHQPKRGGHGGKVAGTDHRLGYRVIWLCDTTYYAHRLAWLYVNGEWPDGELDHINGDKADNRIANLRLSNRAHNLQNIRQVRSNKTSCNLLGVTFDPRMKTRPWRGVVNKAGKNYDCGYWKTPEEAHAAYVAKKRELHEGCTL